MSILDDVQAVHPSLVVETHRFRGDQTALIYPQGLLPLVKLLSERGFNFLVDITAVDWYEKTQRPERFEVVYHWLNLVTQERLRIKVLLIEKQVVPTLSHLFETANWYEREIYDLFGITFEGHPNLIRLLTWPDFPGHALRKDFPLDGGDPFCMLDSTAPFTH